MKSIEKSKYIMGEGMVAGQFPLIIVRKFY